MRRVLILAAVAVALAACQPDDAPPVAVEAFSVGTARVPREVIVCHGLHVAMTLEPSDAALAADMRLTCLSAAFEAKYPTPCHHYAAAAMKVGERPDDRAAWSEAEDALRLCAI